MKYGLRSYFEREWLDNALLVGMTPDEFWYGDPELYYNYTRVYELKQKERQKEIWTIGVRFCQALQSTLVFPAGVVDGAAIRQMPKYPDCPYTDEIKEEYTEEEIAYLREKAYYNFKNWVDSFKRGDNNGG